MNVCFETFGCRLNRAEALDEEARWVAAGHRVVASHREADTIVIRGCSVTHRAQSDCERLVAHLRRKYPDKPLRICGCLPHAVREPPKIPDAAKVPGAAAPLPMRTARAYLKVQDGCSGSCTFCIVPRFRGRPVSVPAQDVLDRARRFADAGYREIVVTGCNLAQYSSGGRKFPDLVAALADAVPECRLRLGSVEPGAVAAKTLGAMAGHANCCRFIHLAVQSGSDDILRAMRRPYSSEDVAANAELALRLMPGLGLGCDLMTGFPGETDQDFYATRRLLLEYPFTKVHVFPFSARPGTPAALMPRQVDHPVRSVRARVLAESAEQNRDRFARGFVGRTVEIVCESAHRLVGWTDEYLEFEQDAKSAPRSGLRRARVRVRVRSAKDGRLCGVAEDDDGR